jgi:hypothetical protein
MSIRYIGRRTVLRGLTGVAVGLPLLEIMGCRREDGEIVRPTSQAVEPGGALNPQRLLIYCTPNGVLSDLYFPGAAGGETEFTLPAIHGGFADMRDQVVFLDGVDNTTSEGGHESGNCSLLTGMRALAPENSDKLGESASIDQQIGQYLLDTDPSVPPDLVLTLGTNDMHGWNGSVSYSGPRSPAVKISRGSTLFEKLFAGQQLDPARQARLARRASVLDDVIGDYDRLRGRLGATDKQRIDNHLESLRQVEKKLTLGAKTCTETPPPPVGGAYNDSVHLPQILDELFAVTAQAMACDLTRVVTLMVRTEGGQSRWCFPWIEGWGSCPTVENDFCIDNSAGAVNQSHHEMSHYDTQEPARAHLADVYKFHMDQLASFAHQLQATDTLSSSLLVHTSGIARGDHSLNRMPLMLVGSLAGRIPTGRRLTYNGASLNDLWLALHHAFGNTQLTAFGDPGHSTGPLAGLLA